MKILLVGLFILTLLVPNVFAQTQNNQQLIDTVNEELVKYEEVHDNFLLFIMSCQREILILFTYKVECENALKDIQHGGLSDKAFDDLKLRYASLIEAYGVTELEHVTSACGNEVQYLKDYTNLNACAHFLQDYNNLMMKTLESKRGLIEDICNSKTNNLIPCDKLLS